MGSDRVAIDARLQGAGCMVQGGRCQAQDAERTKDLRKSVESVRF